MTVRESAAGGRHPGRGETADAEGQPASGVAATRRLGIGGKLLAAFGAIAALTIAATVTAWILFGYVRENITIIADDSLPAIAASFRLAEQSAQISATIPRLVAARTSAEIEAVKEDLDARLDAIRALGDVHRGHQTHAGSLAHEVQEAARSLRAHVEKLEQAVRRVLSARRTRESRLHALSSEHEIFIETMRPIVEAVHDQMLASTRRSVADGTARIAGLIDESIEALRGTMQIRSNVNLVTAVLHQIAASGDVRELSNKRIAIVGPIAEIRNDLGQISEIDDADLLERSVSEILAFAVGSQSLFELKKAAIGAKGQRLEALNRDIAAKIVELNRAHAAFLTLSRDIVDAADHRILEAAAIASREGRTIISDTDEGIERLETVLFIHSDTNHLFGLLGEAGTAIYSDDIAIFRGRFEALRDHILEQLIVYESSKHDPAVRDLVESILTYGIGENSILESRLAELEAAEDAGLILTESQRLAGRLSDSATGMVEESEQAGLAAETSTRVALSRGELVLAGISALSLAGAILIAWLYVFRRIVHRLTSLSTSMLSIAKGDLDTDIVFKGGNDEITDMRKALIVFRDDAFKRRQAEEALRESEQRLRLILATSPIGVGISRADGTLVYANERFAEQFNQSAEEIIGTSATDLYVDLEDRKRLLTRIESDGFVRDAEVLLKRVDDTQFWSLISFFPIEYSGKAARLGWIYDITERKRAEEELRQAKERAEKALAELKAAQERLVQTEKMASLGQLTAGVAHEIKNPLNFVKNFSEISIELLEELKVNLEAAIESLEKDDKKEVLGEFATIGDMLMKIREHGDRANSIVQSMLSHTREGPATTRSTDLNALLEESLDLAYHAARAEDKSFNVTIERTLDPDVGELELYPADLMRVFLNLIGNAFYATKERVAKGDGTDYAPTVAVSTQCRDGMVEIRVRDNGIGIPVTVKDKIFDPFFTTKPPGEGTGLGLSLSYETVVQQHKGWMEVSSKEGEFTEFVVTLPR